MGRKQIQPEAVDRILANCVANQQLEGLICTPEDVAAARRIITGETTLAQELAAVVAKYQEPSGYDVITEEESL